MGKLKAIHWFFIWILVDVIVAVGLFFVLIKPKNEEIVTKQGELTAAQEKADTLPKLIADKKKAEQDREMYNRSWVVYQAQYFPDKYPLADRYVAMIDMWREMEHILAERIRAHIERQPVTLLSAIKIGAAPIDPNQTPATKESPITTQIGDLLVVGTYENILKYLNSWNKFDRLATINSVTLSGVSPRVACQISLTIYQFPKPLPPGMASGRTLVQYNVGQAGSVGAGGDTGGPNAPTTGVGGGAGAAQ
jgi:hypothetical protein